MLFISKEGIIDSERVKVKRFTGLERTPMPKVNGIVVHQTNTKDTSSTFNSYLSKGANGAHFLIDKDGTIYQTASVYKRTNHVGRLQSRCLATKKCTPAEFAFVNGLEKKRAVKPLSLHEHKKPFPDRYPTNSDSIGIEIVGMFDDVKKVYEQVNPSQNDSLAWLVRELAETLGVSMQEIYRHPAVARKMESEAETARW